MEDHVLLFARISQATIVIPLIIGVISRNQLTKEQKILFWIIISSTLTELIGLMMLYWMGYCVNSIVYNIFAIVQFTLINRIYKNAFSLNVKGQFLDFLLVIYVIFAVLNLSLGQASDSVNSNIVYTSSLVSISYALGYFYLLLKRPLSGQLEKNALFWLSAGLLLYNSGVLILFVLMNYVVAKSGEGTPFPWVLNMIFNVMLNTFYAVTLWVRHKE